MTFDLPSGRKLLISRSGFDADLPLVRKDSFAAPITNELWGVYTPSTGKGTALLFGSEEQCKEAVEVYSK